MILKLAIVQRKVALCKIQLQLHGLCSRDAVLYDQFSTAEVLVVQIKLYEKKSSNFKSMEL